jgi:hypothetical protein
VTISLENFTADGIHDFLSQQAAARRAEEEAVAAHARAEREKLRAAFEEREVPPDALERVLSLVRKALEADPRAKEVMMLHFPSEFMSDSGRSITSHSPDWPKYLTGFAARAYAAFEQQLAPRGFTMGAQILDYPGGMPGDVGLFLNW